MPINFVSACLRFFGKPNGESTTAFYEELRQLTHIDKADMLAELEKEFDEKIEVV